jgi:hypothetical protein
VTIAIPVGIAVPVVAIPRLIAWSLITCGLSIDTATPLDLLIESFLGQVEQFLHLLHHGIRIGCRSRNFPLQVH